MGPIEQADLAVARHRFVNPPEKVVRQLLRRGCFEVGGLDPGRLDGFEHPATGSVFAAAIHALQQNDYRVRRVGIKQVLQFADAPAKPRGFLACPVLVQPSGVIGVEVLKSNL